MNANGEYKYPGWDEFNLVTTDVQGLKQAFAVLQQNQDRLVQANAALRAENSSLNTRLSKAEGRITALAVSGEEQSKRTEAGESKAGLRTVENVVKSFTTLLNETKEGYNKGFTGVHSLTTKHAQLASRVHKLEVRAGLVELKSKGKKRNAAESGDSADSGSKQPK